jgi:Fe2+ transport system protein FeoA
MGCDVISVYNTYGRAKTSQHQETPDILCSNQIVAKLIELGVDIGYKIPLVGVALALG